LPGQTGAFVDHFKLISQVVRRCAAALPASLPYPLQVSRAESSAPRPSFMSTAANRLCSTLGAETVDRFMCCQRVLESWPFWLEDGWVVVALRIAWSAASCFSDNGASTRPQRPVYTYRFSVLSVWSPRLRYCAGAQTVVNVVAPASARTSHLDCVAVVEQASRALSPGLQQACYAHATSARRLKLDGARVRQPDFPKHNLNYSRRGTLSITPNKYAF